MHTIHKLEVHEILDPGYVVPGLLDDSFRSVLDNEVQQCQCLEDHPPIARVFSERIENVLHNDLEVVVMSSGLRNFVEGGARRSPILVREGIVEEVL